MSLGKKAVSPIIATILLIVFAMILGIIVMNVGGNYLSLEEGHKENIDVLNIIDKCVNSGAITQEESGILLGSLS